MEIINIDRQKGLHTYLFVHGIATRIQTSPTIIKKTERVTNIKENAYIYNYTNFILNSTIHNSTLLYFYTLHMCTYIHT